MRAQQASRQRSKLAYQGIANAQQCEAFIANSALRTYDPRSMPLHSSAAVAVATRNLIAFGNNTLVVPRKGIDQGTTVTVWALCVHQVTSSESMRRASLRAFAAAVTFAT